MPATQPPRLYVIPAASADVAAVFRRGPSQWWHVMAWRLDRTPGIDHGAWIRATLSPRRSDLSPNGRLLCYSAFSPREGWESEWKMYRSVSRLPWLKALVAWSSAGDVGVRFLDDRRIQSYCAEASYWNRVPFHGSFKGLELLPDVQGFHPLRNELSRGWRELPEIPASFRFAEGWTPNHVLLKDRSAGSVRLMLAADIPRGPETPSIDHFSTRYWIAAGADMSRLEGVTWCDWDKPGHLLVATSRGTLEVRRLKGLKQITVWECDLNDIEPDPRPAPAEADCW